MKADRERQMPAKGGSVDGASLKLEHYLRRQAVDGVRMTLQCPSCLKGELRFTGFVGEAEGGIKVAQHRCGCGYEIGIGGKMFPSVDFEPSEWRQRILDALNELAKRVEATEAGIACLHERTEKT